MIRIFDNVNDLSVAAAELFVDSATKAISERGTFNVALTGGSSPHYLYELLANKPYCDQIDWKNTFVFWGDERWVPLTDSKSNAAMAKDVLLDKVSIPESQIFPMWKADTDPVKYAETYQEILLNQLGESGRFDLLLSGMGDDGHTASLFPHTKVLNENKKWVDAYYLGSQSMYRITLTALLINKSLRNIVIAFGSNKANALKNVFSETNDFENFPAKLLKSSEDSELIWLIDVNAAAELSSDIKQKSK